MRLTNICSHFSLLLLVTNLRRRKKTILPLLRSLTKITWQQELCGIVLDVAALVDVDEDDVVEDQ